MKKISILLVILILSVSMVWANGDSEGKDGGSAPKIKAGFSLINLADTVIAQMVSDAKVEADKLGIDLLLSDAAGDPDKQINAVQNFIAAKCDVIIIQALDAESMSKVAKEAMDQGIKIVAYGIGLNNYDCWYKNDNYAVGKAIGTMAGEWINENAGGKASVGLIEFPVVQVLIDRADGIRDGLSATAPAAEIVVKGSAIDSANGANLADTFLQKDPNLNVIVSISDGPALGAYEAVKAAGKDNENFAIFGSDLSEVAVANIAKVSAYRGTIDCDSKVSGVMTMDIVHKLATNQPIDDIIVMGVIPVSIDNISEYTK